MNKTFLLTAEASHTEGVMLLVIDSLEDFRTQFIAYHAKKCEFMLNNVPEFYDHAVLVEGMKWFEIMAKQENLRNEFVHANNYKPFDFEISIGCSYIKEGRGAGNFYNDLKIITDPNSEEEDYWKVAKQFLSDLPTGTHYS